MSYAISELVGCAVVSIMLIIFLIVLVICMFFNPGRNKTQRFTDKCMLMWALSLFAYAIIKIFWWTDIAQSFPDNCHSEKAHSHCGTCDWTAKIMYFTDYTEMAAALLYFYEINTEFHSEIFIKRLLLI